MKKSANPRILTINGGSSSIKFAQFEAGDVLDRILEGEIDRIGAPEARLRVTGLDSMDTFSQPVTAPDHTVAVGILMDWIEARGGPDGLTAVGHRVVHGGPSYWQPQRITAELLAERHRTRPIDPAPLPGDLRVAAALHSRLPDLPNVDCFGSLFHPATPPYAPPGGEPAPPPPARCRRPQSTPRAAPSLRRLAHPARAGQHPCVMQFAAVESVEKGSLGGALADQFRRVARVAGTFHAVWLGGVICHGIGLACLAGEGSRGGAKIRAGGAPRWRPRRGPRYRCRGRRR